MNDSTSRRVSYTRMLDRDGKVRIRGLNGYAPHRTSDAVLADRDAELLVVIAEAAHVIADATAERTAIAAHRRAGRTTS